MREVGFMQGRFSDPVKGKIQAFPWSSWQEEFLLADRHGFRLMEWTLDRDRLHENPLLTVAGQADICALRQRHGLAVPSLTGDCFMQAPFWKAEGVERETLQRDFRTIAKACAALKISTIVVPLVDNGRLENLRQEEVLVAFMDTQLSFLADHGLRVIFESDFDPRELARFIARFDPVGFGINYDIGNSAALGFRPAEEIAAYGHRIKNVHVKDRRLGGATVPLGTGSADFEAVFGALARIGYTGSFILQTARAADGDHAGAMCRYRDMTVDWLSRNGA